MKETIIKQDFYELLPLEEVKHFLRINGEHDDNLLKNLSQTAIDFAENYISFELQKKEINCVGIFKNTITLRKPLIAVLSVKAKGKDVLYSINYNILLPNIKIGSEIEINYLTGIQEGELKAELKTALIAHILSLYDLKNGGGTVPNLTLEIYNKYKKINL